MQLQEQPQSEAEQSKNEPSSIVRCSSRGCSVQMVVGIVPVIALRKKEIDLRFVRLASSEGTAPDNLFICRCSLESCVKAPNSVGKVPVNPFSAISSSLMCFRRPIWVGNELAKEF